MDSLTSINDHLPGLGSTTPVHPDVSSQLHVDGISLASRSDRLVAKLSIAISSIKNTCGYTYADEVVHILLDGQFDIKRFRQLVQSSTDCDRVCHSVVVDAVREHSL